jgi:hypothetical protein
MQDEDLISLTEGAREFPGRPHVSTLWRWATAGFRGCVLETVTVAGRRFTSKEAISRFQAATNRVRSNTVAARVSDSDSRAILQRAGILEPQKPVDRN